MFGFVFQSYNLLPRMPAIEQVELPLMYQKAPNRRRRAAEAGPVLSEDLEQLRRQLGEMQAQLERLTRGKG